MIKITNLNKIYSSKKRKKCHALNKINLTLPDSGFVFVLGKSGSGKSTLLNLIGGLDNITSGKIVVNGNDLSRFSEKDFCNYRNTHIGFIFQDYHLINDLTVYDNIALSLHLKNDIGEESKVAEALERVGLGGYETRYPSELSGGEQQRVAIARALVKKPRIILADEPTGNLDVATAKDVMGILKELSRECLILIVSHNVNDADTYADRIIELARGTVISDKIRNPKFPSNAYTTGSTIVYPAKSVLSDDDIDLINTNPGKKIVKFSEKFIDSKPSDQKSKKVYIFNKSLTLKHKTKLSTKFLKHKHITILLSSFMVAVIMVIMALAQTINSFDGNAMIESEIKKANIDSVYLEKELSEDTKELLDTDFRSEIGKTDIQKINDAGYNGKIYPVYNVNVPVRTTNNSMGLNGTFYDHSLFIKESLGTMVVDEDFFREKFGKVNYLAKLDEPKEYGLVITDYVADAILATSTNYIGKNYVDILGTYLPLGWKYDSIYINSVIETGYKTKHKVLMDKFLSGEIESLHDLETDQILLDFMTDVYDSIGFSYSLSPNFSEIAYQTRTFFSSGKLVFNNSLEYVPNVPSYVAFIPISYATNLAEGEISFSRSHYNDIFGTNYEANALGDFVPHKVKISSYRSYDVDNENPLFTYELTIAALHNSSDMIFFNPENSSKYWEEIGTADTYAYALYLSQTDNIKSALDITYDMNYSAQGHIVDGIRTMTKAVDVFVPIFKLISIIISAGVILIMLNFSSKMINDKMHDIGILKALGTKNGTIGTVFGLQVMLIALFTSIMSVIGYYIFIDMANDVLFMSLKRLAPSRIVLDLDFLVFKPMIAITNCIMVFVLAFISLILPLLKIKMIKPVKIIKAKE